jgi:3-phenylpropionate/trans-cinnamate dioxygenase ferredoxin reductase component
MRQGERYVIVGGGIAGVTAAETLRTEGFDGEIVVIDGDENLPYDRPPLSKELLINNQTNEESLQLREPSFYADNKIYLELGKFVKDIDVIDRKVVLEDGRSITWDKILLTTGSTPRSFYVKGASLPGVHYLKDLNSALSLRNTLTKIDRIVIIGAGFIGLEVAAACRKLGIDVTIIELMPTPLAHVVGTEVGNFLTDFHKSQGVKIITEDKVKEIRGSLQATEVITESGHHFPCDAVLVSIGVNAENSLIKDPRFGSRITVNDYGETDIPGVFAAGDCAYWNYFIEGSQIRVEHWDHAINHGKVVAKNMVRPAVEKYRVIPYFWSDHYEEKLQYIGHPLKWDSTVMRGSFNDNKFTIFFIRNERVVGALAWNDSASLLPTRRLIERQEIVNIGDLSDTNKKLRKLVSK